MPTRSKTSTTVQNTANKAENVASKVEAKIEHIAEQASEVASETIDAVSRVLHFEQLPPWMKIDPYIRRGYRKPTGAVKDCIYSLCYPHNEFVNTWSHLLPAMFFLCLLAGVDFLELKVLEDAPREVVWADMAMMQFYFVCTTLCLLFSAGFHGMNAHSSSMAQRTLKLDYLGIVLTISSTCITSTYFGMYDHTKLQTIYIAFTTLCAATVFLMVLNPDVDGPNSAAWRTVIFIALAGSGFGAVLHASLTDGLKGLEGFPLLSIAVTCTCYLVGAFLYVRRIPEKYWPGTFDFWGASHQLFHILVAVGQINFLYGLKDVLLMRYR